MCLRTIAQSTLKLNTLLNFFKILPFSSKNVLYLDYHWAVMIFRQSFRLWLTIMFHIIRGMIILRSALMVMVSIYGCG